MKGYKMNVNISKINFETNENTGHKHITWTSNDKKHDVYLSTQEIELSLAALQSDIPVPLWRDVSNVIGFYQDCIVFLSDDYDRQGLQWGYYNLPKELTIRLLEDCLECDMGMYDESCLLSYKREYQPLVKVVISNDNEYNPCLSELKRWKGYHDNDNNTCIDMIRRVTRIARNASNPGVLNTVELHISCDHAPREYPMSYYWVILVNDKQYMNGGIIFHRDHDNPMNGSYSIHT